VVQATTGWTSDFLDGVVVQDCSMLTNAPWINGLHCATKEPSPRNMVLDTKAKMTRRNMTSLGVKTCCPSESVSIEQPWVVVRAKVPLVANGPSEGGAGGLSHDDPLSAQWRHLLGRTRSTTGVLGAMAPIAVGSEWSAGAPGLCPNAGIRRGATPALLRERDGAWISGAVGSHAIGCTIGKICNAGWAIATASSGSTNRSGLP